MQLTEEQKKALMDVLRDGEDWSVHQFLFQSQEKSTEIQEHLRDLITEDLPMELRVRVNDTLQLTWQQKELARKAMEKVLLLTAEIDEKL